MKVYVLDPIGQEGLEILKQHCDVVQWDSPSASNWREDAEGIILRGNTHVTADDLSQARNLKVISKQGAGVDRIDLAAARARGIVVMNTPGANAEAVAEFTVGLTLAMARRIALCDRRLRAGDKVSREDFIGRGFEGKTVGVIGLGHIGRRVAAKWNRAFDMPVIGYDPHLPDEAWAELGYERTTSLDSLLARADLVSIHAALTDETRRLIGVRELGLMKPTAMLVCTSRGGIVRRGRPLRGARDRTNLRRCPRRLRAGAATGRSPAVRNSRFRRHPAHRSQFGGVAPEELGDRRRTATRCPARQRTPECGQLK